MATGIRIDTPDVQQLPTWVVWAVGGAGSVTRICLLKGRGDNMNLWQMSATLLSGTVCAGFGAGSMAQWVPGLGSVSLGISAFVAGMFGMVFAEYVVTLGFPKKEPTA